MSLKTSQNFTELLLVEVRRPFKRCEVVARCWQRQGSSPSTHSLLVEVKHHKVIRRRCSTNKRTTLTWCWRSSLSLLGSNVVRFPYPLADGSVYFSSQSGTLCRWNALNNSRFLFVDIKRHKVKNRCPVMIVRRRLRASTIRELLYLWC